MTLCFINLIRHSIICGTAAGSDHVILMHITILQPMNILFVSLYITV